ncbi:hypothetical protein THAOC_27542, partial [Thalassiosira oceanica]
MKFLYRHSAVSKIVALAAVALLFKQQGSASVASGTSVPSSTATNTVSEYQPRRKGLGKIVDWGLAKVEAVLDPVNVSELINTFIAKAESMVQIMIHGFF